MIFLHQHPQARGLRKLLSSNDCICNIEGLWKLFFICLQTNQFWSLWSCSYNMTFHIHSLMIPRRHVIEVMMMWHREYLLHSVEEISHNKYNRSDICRSLTPSTYKFIPKWHSLFPSTLLRAISIPHPKIVLFPPKQWTWKILQLAGILRYLLHLSR